MQGFLVAATTFTTFCWQQTWASFRTTSREIQSQRTCKSYRTRSSELFGFLSKESSRAWTKSRWSWSKVAGKRLWRLIPVLDGYHPHVKEKKAGHKVWFFTPLMTKHCGLTVFHWRQLIDNVINNNYVLDKRNSKQDSCHQFCLRHHSPLSIIVMKNRNIRTWHFFPGNGRLCRPWFGETHRLLQL